MEKEGLVRYAISLRDLKPSEVKFVLIDGSVASGEEREFSDYDLYIVKKSPKNLSKYEKEVWGVFGGRLLTATVMSSRDYEKSYLSGEFPFFWLRKSAKKVKLLFGDEREFKKIRIRLLNSLKWTPEIQNEIVEHYYGMELFEYYGKLRNSASEKDEMAFYHFANTFADHFVGGFLSGINRSDIASERNIHKEALKAKVKPPNLKGELLILYGLKGRSKKATLESSRRLMSWARDYLIADYGMEKFSKGFKEVLMKLKV